MLSKRLKEIANMVTKDMIVADIGCDHAFLPVYLVENEICSKVYAIDNKNGPLSQAKKTIKEKGLENNIIPVLNNGLDNLASDVNCLTIAGMGAELIIDILSMHLDYVNKMQEVIVQANTSVYKVREFISENKFTIVNETVVKDANIYYEIIKFVPSRNKELTKEEIWLGPILMTMDDIVYQDYLNKRYQTFIHISKTNPKILEQEEYQILNKYLK